MEISNIQWSAITSTIALLIAIGSGWLVLRNVKKAHNEDVAEKQKPFNDIQQILARDKARLDNHEEAIKQLRDHTNKQDDEMRLILKSQLALLRHGVDGNNIIGLKESQTDIQNYLIDR